MKKLIMVGFILLDYPAWAHHTKDHTMLMENADQVIAMTRQGANDSWLWIVWAGVVLLFALGMFRLISKK